MHKFRTAPQLRGLSSDELLYGLRSGTVLLHGGVFVPAIGGGDPTVDAVMAKISGQLDALDKRAAGGEDVAADRKALIDAAVAEHVAAQGTQPQETSEQKLARLEAEARRTKTADAMAAEIVTRVRAEQATEAEELAAAVQKRVSAMLGDSGATTVEEAVKNVLAAQRGDSRFVTQGASQDLVKHVAAGGTVLTHDQRSPIVMGADREVDTELKSLIDSKSMTRFMGAISRAKAGRASQAERLFIEGYCPGGSKALAEGTPASGGYLVRPEWMPDVLGLLRGTAVVRAAGPRTIEFGRLMNQTAISTGATAYYTAENAAIPKSEQTFAETPLLTPHNLTALVPVSNYLLGDPNVAGGGVDEIVRNDLIVVMALREDLAFLRGTGSSGEPTGLRNMSSITLNPLGTSTNGFQPTLPQLRRMLAVFRTQNAVNLNPVWFFNPAFLTYLEGLTDTLGRFLVDTNLLTYDDNASLGGANPGGLMTGRFLGARFFATNQIPANLTQGSASNATDLTLVNISELIIGVNQELEIDLSSEASYTPDGGTTWINAFQNNQTLFRTVLRHDIAHRRPNQILVQTGVLV